jgi:glutamine cyclotransferase
MCLLPWTLRIRTDRVETWLVLALTVLGPACRDGTAGSVPTSSTSAPAANENKPAPTAPTQAPPPTVPAAKSEPVARYTYQVVHSFPHDPAAFTQGLIFENGMLYESTGLYGNSSLRRVILQVGQILNRIDFPQGVFAEGVTLFGDRLYMLTWKAQKGYVFDPTSLKQLGEFGYRGEGWGLTHDERSLIMSDGTSTLRFLDPQTLVLQRTIDVKQDGKSVDQVNELEYVKGEILANVWKTNTILRIDPATGRVTGTIDLTGLFTPAPDADLEDDVLNGIAYDAAGDRLFVTGKRWPKVFEIKLVKK